LYASCRLVLVVLGYIVFFVWHASVCHVFATYVVCLMDLVFQWNLCKWCILH